MKTEGTYFVLVVLLVVALVAFYGLVLNQPLTLSVLLIAVLGLLLAYMDTAMGMGFGTIGTPILLILGYSSKLAVPSILISQAISAALGFLLHRHYKNVNLESLDATDTKIELRLVAFGVLGTIIAVFVALQLPKLWLNTYIGLLVIAMGLILLSNLKMVFSWVRINLVSFISGFNKAISGGGYGPVATTGLIVSGHPLKNSVGIALFSVAVINITAFALYLAAHTITSFALPVFLTAGALVGSQLGPRITKRMKGERNKRILAVLAIILGILTIVATFVK